MRDETCLPARQGSEIGDLKKHFRIVLFLLPLVLLCCGQVFAAAKWSGSFSAVLEENNPEFVEDCRVRIYNIAGGTIEASRDKGATWERIGSVLYPSERVSNTGYTASKWVGEGKVAAVAVNAIHVKTDYNLVDDKGVIFSILPKDQLQVPEYYNSYISPDSSLYTDISAGEKIFGGLFTPYLGNSIMTVGERGSLTQMGTGFVPKVGDVFVILVERPKRYPKEVVFENRFGGLITLKYLNGDSKVIGVVLRPVIGVGRFQGTQFSDTGRIRANHPGVLDVSTSPLGKIGGFQIIPAAHGMSDEMSKARTSTQWMVVGPVVATDPSPEGVAPLFKYYFQPRYIASDLNDDKWDEKALKRFLVEVKVKNDGVWNAMPEMYIDPDLRKALPSWADRAFEGVTHIRILFPIYD